MVAFNPDIQQSPGYLYGEESARAIGPIPADISKETALQGLGKGIVGGAKVGEDYLQQRIMEQEHAGLDTINTQAIDRLTAAKANPQLLAQEEQRVPPEAVRGLPATLDKLDQARANNKISQTYIDMQKDMLAKSLRAQYPGFRDFVDESFARSNREDPANKYISSLVGDINSLAAAGHEAKSRTATLAIQGIERGYEGADVMANGYFAGKVSEDKMRSWFYDNARRDANEKHQDHAILMENHTREQQGHLAENVASERVNSSVINWWSTHHDATGMSMEEMLKKAGEGPISPDQATKYATQVQVSMAQWTAERQRELDSPIDGDPKNPSLSTLMGPEKAKAVIESGRRQFEDLGKMFSDERAGIATQALRMTKSIEEQSRLGLLTATDQDFEGGSEFSAQNRTLAGLKDMLGPAYERYMNNVVLPSKYDNELATFTKRQGTKMINPPSPEKQPTASETITKIQGTGPKTLPSDKASAAKDFLSNIQLLQDKGVTPEAKANIVAGFFGPKNRDLLYKFARDNQVDVLQQLTNDKVASEIHKLGGPAWEQYKGWVKDTFGTQQFPEEINNLNQLPKELQIGWDNESHQIIPRFNTQVKRVGRPGTPAQMGSSAAQSNMDIAVQKAQESIDHLNAGLKAVSGVGRLDNSMNVNAYLLQLLSDSNLQSLAAEFKKAVITSHTKPEKDNFE